MKKDSKKRLCLFAGYSKNETIADYVVYFLEKLSKYCDIYYYCDSNLDEKELHKIDKYVKKSFAKRHKKYDFGSWQELVNIIGKKEIRKYDELILTNDSCYGPLFSLSETFDKMDDKNVDFWGLSASEGYHVHIQSYFLCFNKKVIETDYLFDFLETVKPEKSLREVCDNYEDMITYYLCNKGFTFDTLIPLGETYYHPYYQTWQCIKEKRFPLLKVKTFYGLAGKEKMSDYKSFLEKYTDYDYKLIEDDLKSRGLTTKEIKKYLLLKNRKSDIGFKIKKIIAKPVIIVWNKYIKKFDKRFEKNNLNVSNSYYGLMTELSSIEQKITNLYEINNIKDDNVKRIIRTYIPIQKKYNILKASNEKIETIKNTIIFPSIDILFQKIQEHNHFNKKRYFSILFYGDNDIKSLTKFYFNNSDILIINQEKDESVEYQLLSENILYNDSLSFLVNDDKNEKSIFNILFVNCINKNISYEDTVKFYNSIVSLMNYDSILITSISNVVFNRLDEFLSDTSLDIDLYTEDLFRYNIYTSDSMYLVYLKKHKKEN